MEYIYRDYEYKVIKLLKSLILSVCVNVNNCSSMYYLSTDQERDYY